VFRYRPCDELITRPSSPTVCKNDHETEKEARAQQGAVEPLKKKKKKKKKKKCKSLSSLLNDYLQSPVTSFLLGTNLLSTCTQTGFIVLSFD
jgi:hypothetical protein